MLIKNLLNIFLNKGKNLNENTPHGILWPLKAKFTSWMIR